ncbi:hypothetical protein GH714_031600 [Hevea brasiliensis]|uniref:J domain-containing protein n=1 Tax=Hevea brasiliensis TaxID=3981 RepID=A0A6A6M285_HEVBR|nr:hypothetical protein GH714_031600 [Hevea brasiliensis]
MILMKMIHLQAEAPHGSESNTLRDQDRTGLPNIRELNVRVEVRTFEVIAFNITCLSCMVDMSTGISVNIFHGDGTNKQPLKGFQFCEDDLDVETIFRSAFGGNRYFYWSFINEENPQWRSSSGYSNYYGRNWRYRVEYDYDSSPESDGLESELASNRLALGLSASGPLKLEDIKNAYRECALKWHPDRHQGSSKDKIVLKLPSVLFDCMRRTLPAGYLEIGESDSEGAIRETCEEVSAEVESASPFAQLDIPLIGQAYEEAFGDDFAQCCIFYCGIGNWAVQGRVGLVSDAFHLTFGCGLLTFSLFAMAASRGKPDRVYTYGYKRLEVLAAFTNAELCPHNLGKSYTAALVYRKAEDMNYHSVCLHVLADSIRRLISPEVIELVINFNMVAVFVSAKVDNAEVLCLGLVSVAVFMLIMPLFKSTAGILLQMAPPSIHSSALSKCLRQVTAREDVSEVSQARFWELVPGHVVGSLSVQDAYVHRI